MNLTKITSRVSGVIWGLAAPVIVWAAPNPFSRATEDLKAVQGQSGMTERKLPELVGSIINVVLGFMGIILLGYLLYAGFLWMTSGGDNKKVDEARIMIKNAIVGLVFVVASVAISNFVITSLTTVSQGG